MYVQGLALKYGAEEKKKIQNALIKRGWLMYIALVLVRYSPRFGGSRKRHCEERNVRYFKLIPQYCNTHPVPRIKLPIIHSESARFYFDNMADFCVLLNQWTTLKK